MRTPPRTATGRPWSIVGTSCDPHRMRGHNGRSLAPCGFAANHARAMHERHAIAVLALELADGRIGAAALSTDAAMALGECVAQDLARIAPDASRFDLVFAAAHFDPAEALRPGWPLHERLAELHARAPRDGAAGARIVAFGADAEGRVPLPLQADPALQGGPLRVLPLLLAGDGVE